VRWLIVVPFNRPGHMGVEVAEELSARGHSVRIFAYRRENALYKNRRTKAAYQIWILRRLERICLTWRPALVLVVKGGPITPGLIRRVKAQLDTLFLNLFPDNPLWALPIASIEAYDVFFTKERYALRSLQHAGLRNLSYLPLYCVPALHHPVTPTAAERARYGAPLSFVGSHYDYRERFMRELADYPLRLWGPGWSRATDPAVRRLVGGGPVWGREKLLVYGTSTLSLNHHHPMNDVVGVNTRAFELAAAGVAQVADFKEDLVTLFKEGEEVLVYRDLGELRRLLDHHLAHPEEARAIGANGRRRALAEHTLAHRLDAMLDTVENRFGPRE
jgi:spore maturation protein CgeB